MIERVKENYNFSKRDERLLSNLTPIMEDAADGFVDAFYKKVMQFKNASKYLKDEKIIERHRGAMREWFLKLFQDPYDDDYLHYLEDIGYTHVKAKLPPHYVNVCISFVRNGTQHTFRMDRRFFFM